MTTNRSFEPGYGLRLFTGHHHLWHSIVVWLLLLAVAMLSGCDYTLTKDAGITNPSTDTIGSGSGTAGKDATTVKVAVVPADTTVLTGTMVLLQATVSGTSNQEVSWAIASGSGSITTDGQYLAPVLIPADSITVVVRAISSADRRASGTGLITVVRAPIPPDTTGSDTTRPPLSSGICFQRDMLPIFQSSCAISGCHAAPGQDGYVFSSYETIMRKGVVAGNPFASEIFEKITEDRLDKRMPPLPRSPLPPDQIELIRRWIAEGAKNTSCDAPTSNCDTLNMTYTRNIKPILQTYCVGCHSGPSPSAGQRLDNFSDVRAAGVGGRLYGVVSHSAGYPKMPYNGNKLDSCRIATIKAWVNQGAKE
ncbi:MAG: hypothetical protein DYG96_02860 [Chlorobi bacterium CHB2]|nr:hypothetical protein [Chlorobi bacterium CHB2]